MNLAERIGYAFYQIEHADLAKEVNHAFAGSLTIDTFDPTLFTAGFQLDHVRITIETKFQNKNSPYIDQLCITIRNFKTYGDLLLYTYNSSYNTNPDWLYKGVWCDIIDAFLARVDEVVEQKLRDMERTLRLPSLYQ